MAGKAFRFHRSKEGDHWFTGDQLDHSVIEQIPDPTGETHRRQVTSIPSPFARLDLVKTAFKEIVRKKDVAFSYLESSGNPKLYHKLVSETLDIAQILYNADKLKDKLKIIAWDPETQLEKLNNGSNRHQLLADTLSLFMTQDTETYHFDKLKRLYFFEYDHTIIGGTSPVTLYFSSPNSFKGLDPIQFGQDTLLSDEYRPLHLRDRDFIKYMVALRWKFNDFSKPLEPFVEFMDASIEHIKTSNKAFYAELDLIIKEKGKYYEETFHNLTTGTDNDWVELFGEPLRKKEINTQSIGTSSDFVIQSSKYKGDHPPLVLQNNFNIALRYTESTWNPKWSVPYYDPLPLDKRILPNQTDQYPYLTVSDFLEPYLLKLPYNMDTDRYFAGNLNLEDTKSGYLLPLSNTFFDFFDTDDLIDGKVGFEVRCGTKSITVKLRIPIKSGAHKIEFSRTYSEASEEVFPERDIESKDGFIIPIRFSLNVFPFSYIPDQVNRPIDYRIQYINADVDGYSRNNAYTLNFFGNKEAVAIEKKTTSRIPKDARLKSIGVEYVILEHNFSRIQVTIKTDHQSVNGQIIPLWDSYHGESSEGLEMAVDFGTTNTHIEFKTAGGSSPIIFDNKKAVGSLMDPKELEELTYREKHVNPMNKLFIPYKESLLHFPTRTVLCLGTHSDVEKSSFTLGDLNIGFYFEKEQSPAMNKTITNLKWEENDIHNQIHIRAFFEQIILMFRAKILLENKSLTKSKLIWFFPASMPTNRLNVIDSIWRDLFTKYITAEKGSNPLAFSESLAPFYYYTENSRASAESRPIASLDIGGETTDVIVYFKNQPILLSSFRFAARSLFGLPFKQNSSKPEQNGIHLKYHKRMTSLITKQGKLILEETYNEIRNGGKSEDIISFWFSLEKNDLVSNKEILNFNKILREDDDLKIIFVLFYTALIYHVASMMKAKNIEKPYGFTFSGTASKILEIVTNGKDSALEEYTQLIVESVYNESFGKRGLLKIYREKNHAKEVTCRGGLLASKEIAEIKIKDIKEVYLHGVEDENITYAEILKDQSEIVDQVEKGVMEFFDFFFELDTKENFVDSFGVKPQYLSWLKENASYHIREELFKGLANKRDAYHADKPLEETLFFYPIIGLIEKLAYEIGTETQLSE